ncbi:T9SS type A sorting domain-containing protein [Bacteroidota bacterium]
MQRKKLISIAIIIWLTSQIIYGQEKQFMYDDSIRTYTVYEPSLDPNPNGHPLVIGLHGTGADGPTFIVTASLIQKAIKEKFIVACPNALLHNLFTYFNAGGGFEELTNGTDDLGFISALIDTMIMNYKVDTTRIYVMGFSNGSAMSYRVAAELSYKIAAIGAVSGQMVYEYCNPEFPVPIIHFHGLSDDLIPYEGNGDNVPSVDSVMEIWRGINKCSSIPDTILNENGIIGKKWNSFDGKSDIVLYTIQDQEHEWPRSGTLDISATDVIWNFLKLQNRISITNLYDYVTHSIPMNCRLYQNYPNPINPSTIIKYNIYKPGNIVLRIYNLVGQEIETLINKFQPAGEYEITWQPIGLSSGIYYYRLQAGNFSETKKLIFQK